MRRIRESNGNAPLAMPMIADRLPPASIEAEQGVIGCILLDPLRNIPIAQTSIGKGVDLFYDLRHEALYTSLSQMFDANEAIDPITFQQKLRDGNQLEALGGMPYIAGLMNCVPSASNLDYYIKILNEKYVLRKMIQVCTRAIASTYEHTGDALAPLNELQKQIMEIDPELKRVSDEVDWKQLMARVSERISSYKTNEGGRGLMTGFPDLDRIWRGMKGGQLIVLGARPGMGKSSLAWNICEEIAIRQMNPVGFFSMEMEAEELAERLVSARANVDGDEIQGGDLDDDSMQRIGETIALLLKAPIYICDRGGMSFPYFRAKLRQFVTRYGIKIAIVDYLQLFALSGRENKSIEIGNITMGLKALAKELGIPIVILSQLNRDLEKDERPPRLSDLKDSGAIEQDADKVLLLHEEELPKEPKKKEKEPAKKKKGDLFETPKTEEKPAPPRKPYDPNSVVIICNAAKNRGGKKGIVRLMFRKSYTRFESISKIDEEDMDRRVFDI